MEQRSSEVVAVFDDPVALRRAADRLADDAKLRRLATALGAALTPLPAAFFEAGQAEQRLAGVFGVKTTESFGSFSRAELSAGAALMRTSRADGESTVMAKLDGTPNALALGRDAVYVSVVKTGFSRPKLGRYRARRGRGRSGGHRLSRGGRRGGRHAGLGRAHLVGTTTDRGESQRQDE